MVNQPLKITIILLLVMGIFLLALRAVHKTATIMIGAEPYPVAYWGFKVSDALAASGIRISEGDLVEPRLEESIGEDQTITIEKAGWVVIVADGEIYTSWTAERIPQNLLALAAVRFSPGDQLWWNGSQIDLDNPLPSASTITLMVLRSTDVNLDEDGKIYTIQTVAPTLGEALWNAGIRLYSTDRLVPPMGTVLDGGEIQASLERSREIAIHTLDRTVRARVLARTIGQALTLAGLPLQGSDFSIPPENSPIPEDGQIRIIRVREEIILEQDTIPFGIEFQPRSDVDLDTQRVVQVGEFGIKARRVRVIYEDEQEITRQVEDEWVAKQSKPRIIGYGTRVSIQTENTADGPIQFWRKVEAYATSYSPCRIGVPDKCSNRTASGKELQKGVIGVIRSWYNTMKGLPVYISGYGFATIEDIGGGFPDRHWVDLGYSDSDWVNWSGNVTVYFLAPAPANIMYILE